MYAEPLNNARRINCARSGDEARGEANGGTNGGTNATCNSRLWSELAVIFRPPIDRVNISEVSNLRAQIDMLLVDGKRRHVEHGGGDHDTITAPD